MALACNSEENVVHVYIATLEDLRPEHLAELSTVEQNRAATYRRPDDRTRFLLGALLIRRIAKAALAVPSQQIIIDRTCPDCDKPHGPPTVEGWSMSCSVSHSGHYVALAVNENGPVGIDIESSTASLDHLALPNLLLAPDEVIPSNDREWLTTWTRKEALVKLVRIGLRMPFSKIHLSGPADTNPSVLKKPGILCGAEVIDLDYGPRFVGALATFSGNTEVVFQDAQQVLKS